MFKCPKCGKEICKVNALISAFVQVEIDENGETVSYEDIELTDEILDARCIECEKDIKKAIKF